MKRKRRERQEGSAKGTNEDQAAGAAQLRRAHLVPDEGAQEVVVAEGVVRVGVAHVLFAPAHLLPLLPLLGLLLRQPPRPLLLGRLEGLHQLFLLLPLLTQPQPLLQALLAQGLGHLSRVLGGVC